MLITPSFLGMHVTLTNNGFVGIAELSFCHEDIASSTSPKPLQEGIPIMSSLVATETWAVSPLWKSSSYRRNAFSLSGGGETGGSGGGGPKRPKINNAQRFEGQAGSADHSEALSRANFQNRFFNIAKDEYEAAVGPLVSTICDVAVKKSGDVLILDLGCGQGHLMEKVLKRLPKDIVSRIVLDYLDPQELSLEKYQRRLARFRLGERFCMRWEEFCGNSVGETKRYDLILAFQSLYSFDLKKHTAALHALYHTLSPKGQVFLAHSFQRAAYFSFLNALGANFHDSLPQLNTAEDIISALREVGFAPNVQEVPFRQTISVSRKNDLIVYIAVLLYLSSTESILHSWEEIEAYLKENCLGKRSHYEFVQDFAIVSLSK